MGCLNPSNTLRNLIALTLALLVDQVVADTLPKGPIHDIVEDMALQIELPKKLTLSILESGSVYAVAMAHALERRGYSVVRGSPPNSEPISVSVARNDSIVDVRVKVATHAVHGRYKVSNETVIELEPVSVRLRAHGWETLPEHDRFAVNDHVLATENPTNEITSAPVRPIVVTGSQQQHGEAAAISVGWSDSEGWQEVRPAMRNLMDRQGVSNYAQEFGETDEIDSLILVFPNDTMRMGQRNRSLLEKFVSDNAQPCDLFSILGCSHGPTALDNGNAVLSTGRAHRVKEQLLSLGVKYRHIRDEACWAPVDNPNLPARGVVLKRLRAG